MKAAIPILALALTGCFGRGEPVVARVPVPVACITPSQVPSETPPLGPIPQSAVQAADALAAKLLEVRGENRVLRSLVIACMGVE